MPEVNSWDSTSTVQWCWTGAFVKAIGFGASLYTCRVNNIGEVFLVNYYVADLFDWQAVRKP